LLLMTFKPQGNHHVNTNAYRKLSMFPNQMMIRNIPGTTNG
jgi:hypothetical protein